MIKVLPTERCWLLTELYDGGYQPQKCFSAGGCRFHLQYDCNPLIANSILLYCNDERCELPEWLKVRMLSTLKKSTDSVITFEDTLTYASVINKLSGDVYVIIQETK